MSTLETLQERRKRLIDRKEGANDENYAAWIQRSIDAVDADICRVKADLAGEEIDDKDRVPPTWKPPAKASRRRDSDDDDDGSKEESF